MRTGFESEAKKMTIKRKWHSRWVKAVTVLASVTVFCTTYALILPAITMSTDTYCGHEEHKHDESCYERQLICVLEEGAEKELEVVTEEVTVVTKEQVLVDAGHTHEEACYETETVLICDIEEVDAKEAVVDEETGEVIEEAVEGHTHTDACYEAVETLVCGEEEREAVYEEQEVETVETVEKEEVREVSGHKHTDACYESVLKCTIEEHEHTDICFSNKEAVEEPSDWEKTLPEAKEMTKNPSEDIVLVAKTQVGYRESEANFVMVEGQRKGYTRYGAMFGKAYEDWNGMFVQFCMHYAGVNDKYMKGDTDIAKWIKEAQKKEIFFAADAEDFQVKAGDIVFFEKKVNDKKVNTVGIVEEVKEKNIIVIVGDDNNEVVRTKYNVEDKEIVGYVILPEKAEEVEEVVIEETVVETEEVAEEAVAEEVAEAVVEETAEESTEEAPVAPNTGIAPEVRLAEATVIASFYTDDTYTEFANEGTAITISGELPVYNTINDDGEEVEDLAVVVKAYKVDAPQINETDAVLAYDITIFYKEGCAPEGSDGTFQPVTPVKVSFESDLLNAETVQGYGIYHIGDDGETEYCGGDNTELEEGVVSFDAHHFSPYMVSIIDSGIQNDSYGAYPEEENEDEEETVIEETFSISSVFQKIRMLSNSSEADNALATKATVNGQTVYTVKSWTALEQLIEQGKYKDGTDAGNNLNIVIDGIIAAKSQIETKGKTINLSGKNNATIYVDSTATRLDEMFWVKGGTFNVEDVVFSGKKATFVPGTGDTTPKVTTYTFNPVIKRNNETVTVELKDGHYCPKVDGSFLMYESGGGYGPDPRGYDSGRTLYFKTTTGGDLNSAPAKGGVYVLYSPGGNGTGYIYWDTGNSMYLATSNPGAARQYTLTAVTNSGGGTSTPDTWTIDDNSTIDSVNPTNGFFIAADGGATVNLNSGAIFRDIKYTGNASDITPIYVNGAGSSNAGTKLYMNEGSLITNNVIRYPSIDNLSPEELFAKGLNMRYTNDDPVGQGATIDEVRYQNKYFVSTNSVGGVLVNGGTLTLNSGSEISGNVADYGAIRVIGGGTVVQDGGDIENNLGFNGGAVSVQNGTYNLKDGTVSSNRTWWNGAISAMNDDAHINVGTEACKYPYITDNETLYKGGAIFVNSDYVDVVRAVMERNKAHVYGGAIYVNNGNTFVLKNTAITRNTASTGATYGGSNSGAFYRDDIAGAGGGVWTCPTDKTYYNIQNVHIWDNDAQSTADGNGEDFYQIRPYYGGGELRLFDSNDNWTVYYTTGGKGSANRVATLKSDLTKPESPVANRTGVALNNNSNHTYSVPTTQQGCDDSGYRVIIRNNTATNGGGIASNGILAFVENANFENVTAKFSLTKDWDDSIAFTEENKPEIKVTVTIKDQNKEVVATQEVILGDGNYTYSENLFDTILKEDTDRGDYKVTFELPTLYYTNNGQQENIYKALPLNNGDEDKKIGSFNDEGLISIKKDALELWSIEITEQVKVDGEYVDGPTVYNLDFNDLYGSYSNPTPDVQTLPSGATITTDNHNYLLSTTLKNENKDTNLTIVKVDKNDKPLPSTDTKFAIKTFDGKTFNEELSIDTDDSDTLDGTYVMSSAEVEAFFKPTQNNIIFNNSNFFLKEVTPPSGRFEVLDTVVPFRVRQTTGGNYKFVPMTLSQVAGLGSDKVTKESDNKTFTIVKTGDKIKFATTDADETRITGVDITAGEGSLTYRVKNEIKPVEIKVAKLDENGDPLPDANTRFSLRPAKRNGNGLYGTHSNPEDGVLTFNNKSQKIGSGITLEPGKAYALWEEQAPAGYANLGLSILVQVDEYGCVSLISSEEELAKYDLDGTAKQIADAISDGTVSVSDTADENGVVAINIKNFPKTAISAKKKYDSSVPEEYQQPVRVALYADGVNKGTNFEKTVNPDQTVTWTDLPKYRPNTDTSEGAPAYVEIQYTVKEVFEGSNNRFKVSYDYTPEKVDPQTCDTTRTIVGWNNIGVANINGRNFRIVINGKAFYLDGNKKLAVTSEGDTSKYNQMLWSTKYYYDNTYYSDSYDLGLHQVVNGTSYVIAYNYSDPKSLVSSTGKYNLLEFVPGNKNSYIRYRYNGYYYLDGDLEATRNKSEAAKVTFQVPVYDNNTTCTPGEVTPALWTITNYYDTVDLDFEKKWVGDANYTRPPSIDVQLLQNGIVYETVTVNGPDWKYSWKELPKYADGVVATYTTKELLDDDHYSSSVSFGQGTGEKVITGWREVSYQEIQTNQPFRLVAQGNAYYLDSNNTLKTTSKNSSAYYDRMLWTTTKYEPGTYYNGYYTDTVVIGFRSAFNPNYYINTNSSNGYLTASTQPGTYTYIIVNNQIVYLWGGYEHTFSGVLEQYCNGFMTFEVPVYSTENANDKITMTNTYSEHTGLELEKVDENGKSDQWTQQAEFTMYHMRGLADKPPITISLTDGAFFTQIGNEYYDAFYFLVETETPKQGDKEYARLETAIPIKISGNGDISLITKASDYLASNHFHQGNNYNSDTKILAESGNRPAIKVDFDRIGDRIGDGKTVVSASKDQKRLIIKAKNTPIDNKLELTKIEKDKPTNVLAGAEFEVRKVNASGELVALIENPDRNDKKWITGDDGKLVINDLGEGTYEITEIVAPENFHKAPETTKVTVVVDAYGNMTVTTNDQDTVIDIINGTDPTQVSFKFNNTPVSYELPETGGIGTTVFALIGTILIMVAAVLLAVRRRLAREMR